MEKKKLGKFGEDLAVKYLRSKGYKILERNFCFYFPKNKLKGEIDIVAQKGKIIFFFEVKTLKENENFLPEDKFDLKKKKNLIFGAKVWLLKNKIPLDSEWQIDFLGIRFDEKNFKISHFENVIEDSF